MTLEPRPAPFWRREPVLFAALLAIHSSVTLWLILSRRLPAGHDTLATYILQYLFASNVAHDGEVPLWMPYVAHGLLSNWELTTQAGLFQNALLALGGPPEGSSFLTLFHLGMYLDELLLLLGVWALGKRFDLSPPALFFTAAAAMGSAMWSEGIHWNHRAIFALPMVLALLQGYLEEGRRWKLHAGINLLIVQILGNVAYIALLTGSVVTLYFLVYVIVWRRRLARTWRTFLPRPGDLALLAVHAAVLACVLVTLFRGLGEMLQYRQGRNPDGSVSLASFLEFGGATSPVRYLEMALGTPSTREVTLYCGIPVLALAGFALFRRPGRRTLHLGLVLLLVLSFSFGILSVLPFLTYYAAPPFRYFRYISLASPIVKLFLILLAGVGFDALRPRARAVVSGGRGAALSMLAVGLVTAVLALAFWTRSEDPSLLLTALRTSSRFSVAPSDRTAARSTVLPILTGTSLAALLTAALFWKRPRAPAFALLLLLLETADVYRWRIQILSATTVPLNDSQAALQRVEPVPYAPRRTADYGGNPRYAILVPASLQLIYDVTDGFLHHDPLPSKFWSHHWMRSIDLLARAYWNSIFNGDAVKVDAELRREHRVLFPRRLETYDKLMGATEDKIQVFSGAYGVRSDGELQTLLNDPRFKGDVLLLAGERSDLPPVSVDRLGDDGRCRARHEVLGFGANGLRVSVDLPPGQRDAWLVYADAWHSSWTARVNGAPVPVERAFLAYKAVRMGPGKNLVEFRFEDPWRSRACRVLGLNALGWILALLAATLYRLGALRGAAALRTLE